MNNLFVIVVAGSIGLTLFSTSRQSLLETESSITALHQKSVAAQREANRCRTEMRRLEKLFVSQQQSIQRLRADVRPNSPLEMAEDDFSQLTPQKEGFWPKDRPYFYIAKSRLQGLDYWPLTDDNLRFSQTAAALFGMSSEEERAANEVYGKLIEQIHGSEISHAIPTNAPAWIAGWPGAKESFYLEPIPREDLQRMEQEFKAALQDPIGDERATLVANKIGEALDNSYGLLHGRTLTLVRDGDRIQLCTSDDSGDTTIGRSATGDGKDEIPKYVRHLFSE